MKSFIEPIAGDVKAGRRTAISVIETALKNAKAASGYNAIISLIPERARERAALIDVAIKAGKSVGPLAGVPFIAKDSFLTFGGETTAGSNILKGFRAPYQATVIEKLEAAGAVCIGKANQDAFGQGASTENSDFGPTKNPHDKKRVPGGSSGGSGAVVALDIVPFALGTDTGGSSRLPASYCGVVGFKPSYGLISRYGVVAMASSTDTVGTLAKTAYDVGLLLDVIAGHDPRDAVTLPTRAKSYLTSTKKQLLKIGLIKEFMPKNLHPPTRRVIEAELETIRAAGHTIEEVSLPLAAEIAVAIYYIVMLAEVSSNLARFDGIKYGYSSPKARTLNEVYTLSRDEGFNAENTRRIMIGNYVLSGGYYDAYYQKAQTARTLLISEYETVLQEYDLLISPTAPGPAFKLGERTDDPLDMYLADIMTVSSSLAGLPAVSIPTVGKVDGLPIGLQITGAYQADKAVLDFAHQIEELQP